MVGIFDIYHSGYKTGKRHGNAGQRRRASWELRLTKIIIWLPFTDTDSFLMGYCQGYHDALQARGLAAHLN